jgi:WD40 repeat protein
LWNADTLELKGSLHGHSSEVWCAAFSPDGRLLATGSKDQTAMLWSTDVRVARDRLPGANDTRPVISPDGTWILNPAAPASASHSVLWSMRDRKPVQDALPAAAIGFSPDGKRILGWAADGLALESESIRDATRRRIPLARAEAAAPPFNKWGFSPDFAVFFAIDRAGVARFWVVADGSLLGSVRGPEPPVRAAVLGPAGRLFAVSTERDNAVRLYLTATGRELRLVGHRDFVSGLAFSPDGTALATGGMDGAIRLWDTTTGRELALLPGHMDEATDVAFSPDGVTLASVGRRESLKFWHVPTRRELFTIDFPQAGGYLQFSPDGSYLAVSAEDHSLRLLDALPLSEADTLPR